MKAIIYCFTHDIKTVLIIKGKNEVVGNLQKKRRQFTKLSGSLYIQPQCCFYYAIINAQTSLLYSRKDGSMVKGYQGLAWTSGMEII